MSSGNFRGNVVFNAVKSIRVSNLLGGDALGSEDLGMLEFVVVGGVVEVRGSVVLLTIGVGLSLLGRRSDLLSKVVSGEDAEVGDHVVSGSRLEVVQVREGGAVGVAEVEGHVGVSVVDGVAVLTLEVVEDILLHDGGLGHGGSVGTGSLSANAISECEDVLVMLVLHGVLVDLNTTLGVTEVGDVGEDLVGLGRRVDHSGEERFLDNFVSINVSEDSDFLSNFSSLDFDHFPSEHDVDVTLAAFLKSDLVGVAELVNVLVRGPVHHAGGVGATSVHHVLSHEVLVVEGVEVGTFSLVGGGGRVADEVSGGVVPSSPVVSADPVLVG